MGGERRPLGALRRLGRDRNPGIIATRHRPEVRDTLRELLRLYTDSLNIIDNAVSLCFTQESRTVIPALLRSFSSWRLAGDHGFEEQVCNIVFYIIYKAIYVVYSLYRL